MGLPKVAVHLNVLRNVDRLCSDKLQQRDGHTSVPGGDSGLGFNQIPPAALQVGGWRAVQGHVGQLVVEQAVVFGFDLIPLSFSHQTLGDQLVGVGVRDTLTRAAEKQQGDIFLMLFKRDIILLVSNIKYETS